MRKQAQYGRWDELEWETSMRHPQRQLNGRRQDVQRRSRQQQSSAYRDEEQQWERRMSGGRWPE